MKHTTPTIVYSIIIALLMIASPISARSIATPATEFTVTLNPTERTITSGDQATFLVKIKDNHAVTKCGDEKCMTTYTYKLSAVGTSFPMTFQQDTIVLHAQEEGMTELIVTTDKSDLELRYLVQVIATDENGLATRDTSELLVLPSQSTIGLSIEPRAQHVQQGEIATYRVTLKDYRHPIECFTTPCNQPVETYTLAVKGVMATYQNTISLTPGEEMTIPLTVDTRKFISVDELVVSSETVAQSPAITFTVIAKNSAGTASNTVTATLTVASQPTPQPTPADSFRVTIDPAYQTANYGDQATYIITVKDTRSIPKCPQGATCSVITTAPSTYTISVNNIPYAYDLEQSRITLTTGQEMKLKLAIYTGKLPVYAVDEPVQESNKRGYEYPFTVDVKRDTDGLVKEDKATLNVVYDIIVPPVNPEEPTVSGETVRISLAKGWNLVSIPSSLVKFEKQVSEKKLIAFVWDDESQQYATMQKAKEIYGDHFNMHLAEYAFWVYSYNSQDLWVEVSGNTPAVQVNPGWNLLPVQESFSGQTLNTLGNACSFSAAYQYNAKDQAWERISLDEVISSDDLGKGIIAKAANYCTLSQGTTPNDPNTPPVFPNDCVGEGGSLIVVPNAPTCCAGLNRIPPRQAGLVGTNGICTALCGNGVCNGATETAYNCPDDCTQITPQGPLTVSAWTETDPNNKQSGILFVKATSSNGEPAWNDPDNKIYVSWVPVSASYTGKFDEISRWYGKYDGVYYGTGIGCGDWSYQVKAVAKNGVESYASGRFTFSCITPTTTCTDSDGGKNYFTKGIVTDKKNNVQSIDYCGDSSTLIEYSCNGNSITSEKKACTSTGATASCKDGACVAPDTASTLAINRVWTEPDKYNKNNYIMYISATHADGTPARQDFGDQVYLTLSQPGDQYLAENKIGHWGLYDGSYPEKYYWGLSLSCGTYTYKIRAVDNAGGQTTMSSTLNLACTDTPVASCTDSDGQNYLTSGYVQVVEKNGVGQSIPDSCENSGQVIEMTCKNGAAQKVWYPCQNYGNDYTCKNGACVQETIIDPANTCYDSDGGVFYYGPGFVKGTSGNSAYSYNDNCLDTNRLAEYSCNDVTPKTNYITCTDLGSYTCKDNACVPTSVTQTCSDTDSGRDYAVKGTASTNLGIKNEDFCLSDATLAEQYCVGTNLASEYVTCPNGCSNGSCLEDTTGGSPTIMKTQTENQAAASPVVFKAGGN
jgi:hypothetical protein